MRNIKRLPLAVFLLLFVVAMGCTGEDPHEQKVELQITPEEIVLKKGEESSPIAVSISIESQKLKVVFRVKNSQVAKFDHESFKIKGLKVGSTTFIAQLLNRRNNEVARKEIKVIVLPSDGRYVGDLYFPVFAEIKNYQGRIDEAMSLLYEPVQTGKPHIDESSWVYESKKEGSTFFHTIQYMHTPPLGPPLATCVAEVAPPYKSQQAIELLARYGITQGIKKGLLNAKDAHDNDIPTVEGYNPTLEIKAFLFMENLYKGNTDEVDCVRVVLMLDDYKLSNK